MSEITWTNSLRIKEFLLKLLLRIFASEINVGISILVDDLKMNVFDNNPLQIVMMFRWSQIGLITK